MQSLADLAKHTDRFHEWERRGRGEDTYPHLVRLEPNFRPFQGHRAFTDVVRDDGRRDTFLSRVWDRILGKPTSVETPSAEGQQTGIEELPIPVAGVVEFEVLIPEDQKIDPNLSASLFQAFAAATAPIAFELVGTAGRVSIRITCVPADARLVRAQLAAFLPSAGTDPTERTLLRLWREADADRVTGAEFVLGCEFMVPLPESRKGSESLAGLVGALSLVGEGEVSVFQVLFEPTRHPWASHAMRAVTSPDGEPFFVDAPGVTKLAEQKLAHPLMAVVIRALLNTHHAESGEEVIRALAGAIGGGSHDRNTLVPVRAEHEEDFEYNVLLRCTSRSGMILSLPELASIARLPGPDLKTPALVRTRILATLPEEVRGNRGAVIGEGLHGESMVPVRLPLEARLSHTYVIGASGTGKSTLLEQMILQDIESNRGVAVLDPHGDLVDQILGRIPEHRVQDVVLFDPSDPDWVVGWNILGAQSEVEKEMLASDLVAVWRRLSTSWGDQMTAVLSNAVLAFLESSVGGTLVDLRMFLLDQKFRAAFLDTVKEAHVRSFWRDEFPLLVGRRPEAPILTRLDTLLRSRFVREAVIEREKALDFRALMDGRKIFLAKLAQGAIGEENSALLGSLLVSKFHQTALTRQDTASESREPFFMYIDEFQNMATPSMASLFSGVRKFKLAMCVAHQDLFQIQSVAPELQRSIMASAHTRIVFRVSEEDARQIQRGMGAYGEEELVDLERGEAICRFGKGANTFRLRTNPLTPVTNDEARARRDRIRAESLPRYGRARVAEPAAASSAPAPEPPGRGGKHHKYIQSLIKKGAEKRGFSVTIEQRVLDGQGHVDVALTRGTLRVACEVSVTTGLDHELDNILKCLAAGFDFVVLVAGEERRLAAAAEHFNAHLTPSLLERVQIHTPATLFSFLDTVANAGRDEGDSDGPAPKAEPKGRMNDGEPIRVPLDPEAMLDVAQASVHVRRAPQTLAKLRCVGGGPPFYKIGKNVYYRRADLDAWLATRKRLNTSAPTRAS